MIDVVFLGVGGWLSNPHFGQSGILVLTPELKVLLDAGEGTLERLRTCTGIQAGELDYIIITHSHGDHVLGLPTIAQHLKHPVKTVVLSETADDIRALFKALHIENKLQQLIMLEIPHEGSMRLNPNTLLKWVRARHSIPAISVVLEVGSVKIGYSGDTTPNPDFSEVVRGAELLIHEFSVPEDMGEAANALGHTTTSEIGRVVKTSSPKRIAPIHYYLESPRFSLEGLEGVELVLPVPCSTLSL